MLEQVQLTLLDLHVLHTIWSVTETPAFTHDPCAKLLALTDMFF